MFCVAVIQQIFLELHGSLRYRVAAERTAQRVLHLIQQATGCHNQTEATYDRPLQIGFRFPEKKSTGILLG